MENLSLETITHYPHTRRTLQIETGAAERTVRRWIKKAALTGQAFDGVERFTDEQRNLILSHQSKPKQAEEIEAELVETSALDLYNPEEFLPAARTYQPGDDSALITRGNDALNYLQEQAARDANAGINALIADRRNNGRKLGAMLAQVELGTALQEEQTIKARFFEGQGVVSGGAS